MPPPAHADDGQGADEVSSGAEWPLDDPIGAPAQRVQDATWRPHAASGHLTALLDPRLLQGSTSTTMNSMERCLCFTATDGSTTTNRILSGARVAWQGRVL